MMHEDDGLREAPASAEEIAAAKRLAEALDAGRQPPEDREVRAVVRLFETLSWREPMEDIRRQKLRKELTGTPGRSGDRLMRGLAAAAMAAVAAGTLLAVLILRSPGASSSQRVADRERLARQAFASVAGPEASEHRQAWIYDRQWASRLNSALENQRYSLLTGYASGSLSTGASQPVQKSGGAL